MASEPRVRRFRSDSPESTEALGEAIGRGLWAGDVLALQGEMGSGKTCLARGLARGLGIDEPVTSPTFTLMQEYVGGRLPLYHFDAWMSGRESNFLQGGGADYLGGDGVALIEWSERIETWLSTPHLVLELRHLDPLTRGLRLWVQGEPGEPRREHLIALVGELRAGPPLPSEVSTDGPEPAPGGDVQGHR